MQPLLFIESRVVLASSLSPPSGVDCIRERSCFTAPNLLHWPDGGICLAGCPQPDAWSHSLSWTTPPRSTWRSQSSRPGSRVLSQRGHNWTCWWGWRVDNQPRPSTQPPTLLVWIRIVLGPHPLSSSCAWCGLAVGQLSAPAAPAPNIMVTQLAPCMPVAWPALTCPYGLSVGAFLSVSSTSIVLAGLTRACLMNIDAMTGGLLGTCSAAPAVPGSVALSSRPH